MIRKNLFDGVLESSTHGLLVSTGQTSTLPVTFNSVASARNDAKTKYIERQKAGAYGGSLPPFNAAEVVGANVRPPSASGGVKPGVPERDRRSR